MRLFYRFLLAKSYNIRLIIPKNLRSHETKAKGWRCNIMIEVHRLNGEAFLLNSDMIETIEVTPDTVLRLLNGHRYVVREKVKDVYRKIISFRKAAGYTCIIANTADESE